MRPFPAGIIYLAIGLMAGAFSAYLVIENAGVEPMSAGSPWLSRAEGLRGAAGLYVESRYMLEGRLPPATGQLMEATAETDSEGQPLRGGCIYTLTSAAPLPRWWSLTSVGDSGAHSSRQSSADVDTVIYETNGPVLITSASSPQPGNWLKSPDTRNYVLLYSAVAAGAPGRFVPPFTIKREACP